MAELFIKRSRRRGPVDMGAPICESLSRCASIRDLRRYLRMSKLSVSEEASDQGASWL